MGNHEAEFLADPENSRASKADGIDEEIKSLGLRPYDVASRADPRGRFLHDLPFAARIGGWFFLHSGDSGGRTLPELASVIRTSLDTQGYSSIQIVGPDSILESIGWSRDVEEAFFAANALHGLEVFVDDDLFKDVFYLLAQ